MDDNIFLNSFQFEELNFRRSHHNDKSRGLQYHYLVFVKQGHGTLYYNNKKTDVHPNDMFYIPKGCKYYSDWQGENILFDTFAFKYFPSIGNINFQLQKINYTDDVFEIFSLLMDDKKINCITIGRLYTLLGMLEPVLERSDSSSTAEYTVEKALQLMNNDFKKSIREYALLCGVSESQIYLYFNSVLKKTPNRVRQEIICQRAVSYLTLTDLTIEEICDKTGFSSTSYFRKVFFSVIGKTPSQVRKEHSHSI